MVHVSGTREIYGIEGNIEMRFSGIAEEQPYSQAFRIYKKAKEFLPDFDGWSVLQRHESNYGENWWTSMTGLDDDSSTDESKVASRITVLVHSKNKRVWGLLQYRGAHLTAKPDDYTGIFCGDDNDAITAAAEHFSSGAVNKESPEEGKVSVDFWRMTGQGPDVSSKTMNSEDWEGVKRNYSQSVQSDITSLMNKTADDVHGKMLMFHGIPGTGKTNLLRVLAYAWKDWCDLQVVMDPERLFADSDYLFQILSQNESHDSKRWKLLLMEDCDELISADSKGVSGQAVARLLNATDGFLAQGQNLLIGITTNEDITRLHPALTRAGRCMGVLEIPPLTYEESLAWLDNSELTKKVRSGGGTTLADLYSIKYESEVISTEKEKVSNTGMYL